MEDFCLFVVISSLLIGTLRGQEPDSPYSRCHWDTMYLLNCTSIGITTLGHVLPLEHGHMTSWPRSPPRVLRTMKHINLSYNKMTSLQLNVLYQFTSLETLNVSNNQIFRVSLHMNGQQLEKRTVLNSLQILVIDRNRLTGIPKGMGTLKSLQTLYLSGNRILEIQQDDFTDCAQLQTIDLGNNRIRTIHPDAFRDLRNLQTLKLSSNELVTITPLVFLYSHVMRADIDLSDNLWACDCRILPLKSLLSSMDAIVVWNITCSTPPSRAGHHLLSTEHFQESCRTAAHKPYTRTLVITAGERAALRCDTSDRHGLTKVIWWTPHGIISDKTQVQSHYIDRINDLILAQPDLSDGGLYICVTDMERIAYQVYVKTNERKPLIRNPRNVQLLNSRMRTEEDFALAVSLSVILSFLCAFCLGVFLRPYIEMLWRKHCKSKDLEGNTCNSAEVYENEGFTEENAGNVLGNRNDLQNNAKNHQCVIDVQAPTHSEKLEQRHYVNEGNNDKHPDSNDGVTVYYSVPETKRVTWASNITPSPKVNLKYVMSLIKPINIIAPDSTITEVAKSPTQKLFFPSTKHQDNSKEYLENSSQNHHEDIDRAEGPEEDQLNNFQSNSDILSEIERDAAHDFYDTSSSDNESFDFVDEEDDSSDEDSIMKSEFLRRKLVKWASSENINLIVNLKQLMALIKPINIIAPDSPMTDVPNSPPQDHLFISRKSKYPHNRIETINNWTHNYEQDTRITEKQPEKQLPSTKCNNICSDTLSRPKTNREDAQIVHDSSSSDEWNDALDEDAKVNSGLMVGTDNENISPVVNLKHLLFLIKPINIIAPDSTMTDVPKSPKQNHFLQSNTASYPDNRMENINHWPQNYDEDTTLTEGHTEDHDTKFTNNYLDTLSRPRPSMEADQISYDHSSSDEEWNDALDEDAKLNTDLLRTNLVTRACNENISSKVNLKNLMALIKPINIIAPDFRMTDMPKRPNQLSLGSISRYPNNRMENIDNWPLNLDQDIRITEGQVEKYVHSENVDNNYSDVVSRPKPNREADQIFYGHSSTSDESSDHDEDIVNSDLLESKIVTWTGDGNSPTVNLKHVMALIKPINITAPDFRMTDMPNSRNQFSLGGISINLDNRNENIDNWPHSHDQDTRLTEGQTENRLHGTHFANDYLDTLNRPMPNSETDQILHDLSSSDEESNDEDTKVNPDIPETKLVIWAGNENISPTMNLKHVMALIKPINIIAPDSRITDVPKSPNQFFQSSIYGFPDNRMENTETFSHHHDEDTILTEDQSENHLNNPNVGNNYYDALSRPMPNRETDQIFYDHSFSSDKSSDLDEEAVSNSDLPETKLVTWLGDEIINPTVNLKHAMVLIKPINITAPDSRMTDVPKSPNQFFKSSIYRFPDNRKENTDTLSHHHDEDTRLTEDQSENHLNNPNVGNNYYDALSRPMPNRETDQIFYDHSFSSDKSSDLDEEAVSNSDLPETKLVTWSGDEIINPTVNLKHAMALIKPINIIAPDSRMTDVPKSPNQFFKSSIYRFPDNRKENTDTLSHHHDEDTRLTEDQSENHLNNPNVGNNYYDALSRPMPNRETDQIFYDHSFSSDKSSDLDEEAVSNSDLPETKLVTWSGDEIINPTVNLKHAMALIKPINITAPDSRMTDVPKTPNQFFQSSISRFPDNRMEHTDTLSHHHDEDTRLIEGQTENHLQSTHFGNNYLDTHNTLMPKRETDHIFYDHSSSDEESNDASDENAKVNSDIFKTQLVIWAGDENISPTVNLKRVMALIKPINIIAPDSRMTDVPKSPNEFSLGSISRYPGSRLGNTDYRPHNHGQDTEVAETQTESHLHNTDFGSNYLDTFSRSEPKREADQIIYDNSSSDEESNDAPDEYAKVNSDILTTNLLTWKGDESSPTVSLKHVMALIKPINIIAPDSTSVYPGSSVKNIDNWPSNQDQDTRLTEGLTENQLHSKNVANNLSNTLSKHKPNREGANIFCENSSSDEESTDVDEDAEVNYDLLETKLLTSMGDENISPKVNLKQVMSLIKPINIIAPDSRMTDIPKSPYQFFKTSISAYPDNRMANIDTSSHLRDEDARLTEGQAKNYLNHANVGNISNTLNMPMPNRKADQVFYDHSSSSEESRDLDKAEVNSDLLETKLVTTAGDENISPTVKLKHVMSLIKPLNIIAPDSKMIGMPRRNQFSIGSISTYPNNRMENIDTSSHLRDEDTRLTEGQTKNHLHNTHFGNNYSGTLSRPEHKREVDHIFYDDSSSSEEPNDALDGGGKMSSDIHTTKLTWKDNQNTSPTMNLKHIMALIKPINISAPDSTITDVPKNPKPNHFYLSSKSKYPHNRMENIQNWIHNHDTNLTQGQQENQLHNTYFENNYSDVLSRPKPNKEDNSSSDDLAKDLHGDIVTSDLANTKAVVRASDENISATMNLRHVMSLIKPINIASDVTDKLHDSNYYPDTIDKKDLDISEISYDSLSDDGSFFSFSKSNSLSDDSVQIDFDDEEAVMDTQSSSNKEMYSGDFSCRPGTPVINIPTKNNDDISLTGQQGPKVNAPSGSQGDWPNYLPHTAITLDLYKQEWITKPIVDTETLTMSYFNKSKTYLLPDIGETSTDGNFLDFNVHDKGSSKPQQVGMQEGAHTRADVMSDNAGSHFVKKKKVFDAFSASLKSGNNLN